MWWWPLGVGFRSGGLVPGMEGAGDGVCPGVSGEGQGMSGGLVKQSAHGVEVPQDVGCSVELFLLAGNEGSSRGPEDLQMDGRNEEQLYVYDSNKNGLENQPEPDELV
ncbi:hypothetical protein C0989_002368 [Termitomyces sp. Mn162]|nr:hypothetical protein C0989_002368 [Termitomyces sp. Mn162]